jgi:hypothetical protein
MNSENLIFVSYYPGCCGQFIGGLCDILLNNKEIARIKETGEVHRRLQRGIIGLERLLNNNYISITVKPTWCDEEIKLFNQLMDDWTIKTIGGQEHYVIASHILTLNHIKSRFKQSKIILSIPNNQDEMTLAFELWNIKNIIYPCYGTFPKPIYQHSSLDVLKEYVINQPDILVFNLYKILNEQNIDTNLDRIIKHLNLTDEYKPKAVDFYKEYLKKQQLS